MAKQRANISNAHTVKLYNLLQYHASTPQTIRDTAIWLIRSGWQFRAVDQDRGRCYYHIKTITIPLWVLLKRSQARAEGYEYWYIAHEMAHALAGHEALHGPSFQRTMISICPKHLIFFETAYKSKNASEAILQSNYVPEDL